ncbi:hypothetical protein GGR56DRAFT_665425 [Xylariaceae sp. FL0804]|nr:hypothetical protein GGR56DRAFT_665425 [Xylariaceae sp. FL0804]
MEHSSPEPPHDSRDGEPSEAPADANVALEERALPSSPPRNNLRHSRGRPRVRFDSSAGRGATTEWPASKDGQDDDQLSTTAPHSPGSDQLSTASTQANEEQLLETTAMSDTNSEHTHVDPNSKPEDVLQGEDTSEDINSEAEQLLRAHRRCLETATPDSEALDSRPSSRSNSADGHSLPIHPRGGVFYQLLQIYRLPAYGNSHDRNKAESTTSSGASTPTRLKWNYQQQRSQDTPARLAGATAKLASSTEEKDFASSSSVSAGGQGKKKSARSRLKSKLSFSNEERQVKITKNVECILQRQKYILKMCRALIMFGAPSHRLEEHLATTAKILDIESQFLYMPGCMIVSFECTLTHTTEVKMVRVSQGVNLSKLRDVHEIYKEVLHDVIGPNEALARLDSVIESKDRWPVGICVIMYGLTSTASSTFFNARPADMPIIFMLGSLLGGLQLVVAPISNTYNSVFEVTATIMMTFLSRAFASTMGGNTFCFSALAQGSIVMILPGWLVLSSALELHSKAIVPGSIRMVYAIIYSLFLGYGITVGTVIYGAMNSNAAREATCRDPLSPLWNFLSVPLYVFFQLFTVQAKWKQFPVMIAIAVAGYAVSVFANQRFSACPPIAYTLASFTIGVLANLYSRFQRGVAAAVLLPAVYVLLPGGLASSRAIINALQTAAEIGHYPGGHEPGHGPNPAFGVAAEMVQIAIGITAGLFISALVVYPFGKRRSGLWTL